ncbi:MAG: sensor histidine kinase [Chloroflexota bacterium]
MKAARQALRAAWTSAQTIRVRLTLWYVGLLAVILVAFSAFLYVNLDQGLREAQDRALLSQETQALAVLNAQRGTPRLTDPAAQLPADSVLALYSASRGTLLESNTRQPPAVPLGVLRVAAAGMRTFATVDAAGKGWRVLASPVGPTGQLRGVLVVARPEDAVTSALDELEDLLLVAVPGTLLLAVAGGFFLAARALGPIDRITRAAEEVGGHDLSWRIDLPPTNDEVGRLAATFDRMLHRLNEAFRRERQFTADASHELRTPLAMLTSQADVALERPRKASEYREALTNIRQDASRMGHLLSELLVLARADAGHEQLTRELLALHELVSDVAGAMLPLAESRQVGLEVAAADPLFVQGDQTRLTQLVVNLVDNALKYTAPGGRVQVCVKRQGGWAVAQIADTGVGIAPEHLPHLFERFYRVDRSRSRQDGGEGLGLAISLWIAQAHGGTIQVQSTLHQGSTFTVTLPASG